MNFEVISEITDVETIAVGSSIREVVRLGRSTALVVGEN